MQYHHLLQLNIRIDEDQKSLEALVKQNVIYLFGQTGCGKSTLANAIINGHEVMVRNENGLIERNQFIGSGDKVCQIYQTKTKLKSKPKTS
jgi:predicted GTPase